MDAMTPAQIAELEIEAAIEDEGTAWRNLVPREPWIDPAIAAKSELANFIEAELAAGLRPVSGASISARKAVSGTRPVPYVGIIDRVVYRALSERILQGLEKADRSPEAYKQFLEGPIDLAFSGANQFTLGSTGLGYVVESDVVAFYEYVDHAILQRELELHTGEIQYVRFLVQLLDGMQGRQFGLPQLLDPSDWLSDIYIEVVHRDLTRQGLNVYRYNDDFRIPVGEYSDALDAIEALEESAREVGLVISGHKTFTPTFITYLLKNTNLSVTDPATVVDPTDVEVIVTDYPAEDEEGSLSSAEEVLSRLDDAAGNEDYIDIANANPGDIRELRRAIYACTTHKSDMAIKYIQRLFHFAPSLTPRLVDYIIAIHGTYAADTDKILDQLIGSKSLSEWQALWLAFAVRQLPDAGSDHEAKRTQWLEAQKQRGRGRPLGAEAALAQASRNEINFDDLDTSLRMDPEALAPWFLIAMGRLAEVEAKMIDAVKGSSPLNKLLLDNL